MTQCAVLDTFAQLLRLSICTDQSVEALLVDRLTLCIRWNTMLSRRTGVVGPARNYVTGLQASAWLTRLRMSFHFDRAPTQTRFEPGKLSTACAMPDPASTAYIAFARVFHHRARRNRARGS
jgi:hypothetical protein